MNFIEDLGVKGHLQIAKVYHDGSENIVFDDHNIIVSGMGVGLSHLFTASGSDVITDYQFDRVQIGYFGASSFEVSSTYSLSGPLLTEAEYVETGSNVLSVSADQIKNGVVTTPSQYAMIPFNKVTRINDTSVRYTIVLDAEACNEVYYNSGPDAGGRASINEIGLFMKNPRGLTTDAPILVAYRYFSDIRKTSDFALIFRWTIIF